MLRALFGSMLVAVTAVPTPTPPPQIYRVVSRPLCTQLRERIKPAIGMLLENDAAIKRSPDQRKYLICLRFRPRISSNLPNKE
jgi:hypothetical protein